MTEKIPEHIANNFFYHMIYHRLHEEKKNAIILILGQPGNGKSWTALTIGHALAGDRFTTENVVFSLEALLDLLNDGLSGGRPLQTGDVLVLDEAAINLDSRRFMSTENVLFSQILTIFRKLRLVLIIVSPFLHQVDLRARGVGACAYVNCLEVNHREKFCIAKIYWAVGDSLHGKIRTPLPRIREADGLVSIVDSCHIDTPPESLTEPYEEKKSKFIRSSLQDFRKQITHIEKERAAATTTTKEKIDEWVGRVMAEPEKFLNRKRLIDHGIVLAESGLPVRTCATIAQIVNKKLGDFPTKTKHRRALRLKQAEPTEQKLEKEKIKESVVSG